MGASSWDTDGHNHPKENRQRCFPHYRFRLWYEPERESGGFYIKPRSLLPLLIFAVICVIARSVWMKSTSCLYYHCPFGKSRTMMRAVHQTLTTHWRPTGWRAWFIQHALKLENVLLSISMHKCQHPCFSSFCWFPPHFFFSPLVWTRFQFPQRVDRQSHVGDLAFFLCFWGGWRGVKGERSALCSVLSRPLSTQPLLCNTISPGSY